MVVLEDGCRHAEPYQTHRKPAAETNESLGRSFLFLKSELSTKTLFLSFLRTLLEHTSCLWNQLGALLAWSDFNSWFYSSRTLEFGGYLIELLDDFKLIFSLVTLLVLHLIFCTHVSLKVKLFLFFCFTFTLHKQPLVVFSNFISLPLKLSLLNQAQIIESSDELVLWIKWITCLLNQFLLLDQTNHL